MAITYPLTFPTHTGIRNIQLRAVNAVALSQSPFTYAQQVHDYSGQSWEADITLPAMRRADAETWIAWLISLRGQYGTFYLGDPSGSTARGSAGGSPRVNGASQTGGSVDIDGCTASQTGWLKAGDYIQLGTGSASTLHKVLQDVDSDASGETTLDIWPHLRSAPADNAVVTVSNTKGVFRLASNEQAWSIDQLEVFGITFGAIEAI